MSKVKQLPGAIKRKSMFVPKVEESLILGISEKDIAAAKEGDSSLPGLQLPTVPNFGTLTRVRMR